MPTREDFLDRERPTWCSGCGNFAILNATITAMVEQDIAPHQISIITGIGCGSKLPHYMKVTGYHTLHGRPIPVATGARLANHDLRIMVVHGDGDSYAEGLGHFIHAIRRNLNIVDLVQNNLIYGLTKGQYSPTSEQGKKTPTSPKGSIDHPIEPLSMAITAGATFVARGYSGEIKQLAWLIGEALKHPGYALLDILQPCVTYNRSTSYDFYNPRVYKLEEEDGYDPGDRTAAWTRAQEWGDRIPTGIIYRAEPQPTYEEQDPTLEAGPIVARPLEKLKAEQIRTLMSEIS
jgi:2-oxoglutarate/2-oxoacid ferredoxin oxidoreductase subunit beta